MIDSFVAKMTATANKDLTNLLYCVLALAPWAC